MSTLWTIVTASCVLVFGLVAPASAAWQVDAAHTEINFAVKHFFTPTTGSFSDFEIDLQYNEEDPTKSTVKATIGVASIDTGNESRDGHLASDDWFGAEGHPKMTFASQSVRAISEDEMMVTGELDIKGNKKTIDLKIKRLGTQLVPEQMQEMLGGSKKVASFQASTVIDRNQFDVGTGSWAATAVVGGEVTIEIILEAHYK